MTNKEQEELSILREKVARLEQERLEKDSSSEKYLREIQDLKKTKAGGLNNIQVREMPDQRICLWHVSGHNIGKRVGPIHPSNAEDTFLMFADKGIKLSSKRPTEEFIEKYKQTAEYKRAEEAEKKRRASKNRTRKESEIDRLTQAIAKMSGVKIDNAILPQEAVK